jgi:peptidoglycan hydrolase-like protein with peptidoglycan-binding domain
MRIVCAALLVLLSSAIAGLGVPACFGQAATHSKKKTSSNNTTTAAKSSQPRNPPKKKSAASSSVKIHNATSSATNKNSTKVSGKPSSSITRKSSVRSLAGRKSRKQPGQKTPTVDRVNQIQAALARDGSFQGLPSGKWDDNTVAAMRRFQTAHRLNPSGKLDAPTLQRLGLGSETAGVAAPTPPPGATSRLTSSANIAATPLESGRRQ